VEPTGFVPSFLVIDEPGFWKLVPLAVIVILVRLSVGFRKIAMRLIRLEIRSIGIQVFFPSRAAWIPWEAIKRIKISRVNGVVPLVSSPTGPVRFPETNESVTEAHYLPSLGAIEVCPLGLLRANQKKIQKP
jgi:hypothetical protein